MTITLIRHAKVNYNYKQQYRHYEFDKACAEYDYSPIFDDKGDAQFNTANVVYVSSLKRTHDTARLILPDKEYIECKLFDEVPIKAFASLPFAVSTKLWFIIGRLQWFFGMRKQPESRQQTKNRAQQAADVLESEKEMVTLICHGLFMRVLVSVLKKRGYLLKGKANYNNLGSVLLRKP